MRFLIVLLFCLLITNGEVFAGKRAKLRRLMRSNRYVVYYDYNYTNTCPVNRQADSNVLPSKPKTVDDKVSFFKSETKESLKPKVEKKEEVVKKVEKKDPLPKGMKLPETIKGGSRVVKPTYKDGD